MSTASRDLALRLAHNVKHRAWLRAVIGSDGVRDYTGLGSLTEAHAKAVRVKMDRMNHRLWWIATLLLVNVGAQLLH